MASPELQLLGIPVRLDETLPPGVLELRAADGTVLRSGIGVPWVYETHAEALRYGGRPYCWKVRDLDDITDKHEWPGKSK